MDVSRAVDRLLHLHHHINASGTLQSSVNEHLVSSSCQASGLKRWLPNPGGQPVLIGGMVMDIQGMTAKEHVLQRGTTTPGKVFFSHGGVARNVAECMACLGAPPFLISVLGRDPPGEAMFAHWQELGLPVDGILRKKGIATPIVSAILDPGGEIAASIDDITAIEEHVTSDWICRFEDVIVAAPIVVLDANLLPDAIRTACEIAAKHGVPTWFEPVSVSKSVRAARVMNLVTFVSPSEGELASMAAAASLASDNIPTASSPGASNQAAKPPRPVLDESASGRTDSPSSSSSKASGAGSIFSSASFRTSASTGVSPGDSFRSTSGSGADESRSYRNAARAASSSTGKSIEGETARVSTSGAEPSSGQSDTSRVSGSTTTADSACSSRKETEQSAADIVRPYELDVRKILDAGVRYVVLTLGPRGVCVSRLESTPEGLPASQNHPGFSNRSQAPKSNVRNPDARESKRPVIHHLVPSLPARVVGLTGAGDSVVAGFVAGLVTGRAANPVEAAAFGVAAAKRTVESEKNVPDGLCLEAIEGNAAIAAKQMRLVGCV